MESNMSIYERIINLLFNKETENIGKKELNCHIYQNKTKMGMFNLEEFFSNLLNEFKNLIFDESKEYRKKLEKDITPILIIENSIINNSKNSYNSFILLNPLFDMYKNLEPQKIIDYTKDITELLKEKELIILKNFNELFEVIIFLIIHQEQSVKDIGNNLNKLLKTTLNNSKLKLDDNNIFDFDSFENKILEKTHINQPILDSFLLDWIFEICHIEKFNKYIGKFFYDIIPWILKMKNNKIVDIANKANDCDVKIKEIFLNKYLKYYYKENKQINECILSFIKLVKNKNLSDASKEYSFLYDSIHDFNLILIENDNQDKITNNFKFDNSCTEFNSPIFKKNYFKLKYGEIDKKRNSILFSPITPKINFPTKRSRILDKNLSRSNNINSFDLSQDSENKNNELSKLIPIDTLNDFMELIIECKDITKEEQLNKLNSELKELMEKIPHNYEKFNAKEFINIIIKGVENPDIIEKGYLLDWYQLLCKKYEQKISDESITAIINSILKTIKKQNQEKIKNQKLIILLFQKLVKLNIHKIFSLFADSLNKKYDYFFIYQIDEYLNYYLITSKEDEFPSNLIRYGNTRDKNYREFYEKIYKIFAYNPICLLIFCTLTEYYELSWNIILNLVKFKYDDNYYILLSEFVQLMENTQSNHIRILLLKPQNKIYLVKTLYGILMLLPQGKAYNLLSNRLYSIKGLLRNNNEIDSAIDKNTSEDIKYFINIFIEVQKQKKEK